MEEGRKNHLSKKHGSSEGWRWIQEVSDGLKYWCCQKAMLCLFSVGLDLAEGYYSVNRSGRIVWFWLCLLEIHKRVSWVTHKCCLNASVDNHSDFHSCVRTSRQQCRENLSWVLIRLRNHKKTKQIFYVAARRSFLSIYCDAWVFFSHVMPSVSLFLITDIINLCDQFKRLQPGASEGKQTQVVMKSIKKYLKRWLKNEDFSCVFQH